MENTIITNLKVEVAILKQEVSFINKLFDKMDSLITKIDSQHGILVDKTTKIESNLSYTKEELSELYETLEKTEKTITERINSIERLLSKEIETIQDKVDQKFKSQDASIFSLTEMKSIAVAGLVVIGWVLSHLETVKSFFK
jgi:asparagine synthetase A